MASKRILFISQEVNPYLPATEQSLLGKQLPHEFHANGFESRIFMPKYSAINERRNQLHEVIRLSGMNITISDTDHPLIIKVASLPPARLQAYFIYNDDYFDAMESDEDPVGSNRENNDERIIFYTRGTVETAKKLRWPPDVIVCSGWMSALAPVYLRKIYADEPSFKSVKIVAVIDDSTFQGTLDPSIVAKLKAEGLKEADLKLLKNKDITTPVLQTLMLKYANGIIVNTANLNPELAPVLESTKAKVLPYEEASKGTSRWVEFVNSLLG
ncbi:MAG: glycogen synthase [Bacteroidales bacterium]|nr:glycogen synthase [Bacteroidales bacterium]